MNYTSQKDDEEITTIRVNKRTRRKLGLLINGNETREIGLERILDAEMNKR